MTQSNQHSERLSLAFLWITIAAILMSPASQAQEASDLQQKLARLPQPWQEKLHRLTLKEYTETLKYWEETFPDRVQVDRIGVTLEGIPLPMLKITDQKSDDKLKQVCLVTALHGGPERSGSTAVLHFIEWALSDDPEAVKTRENQLLLIIPIINPYAYFETDRFGNSQKIDPYTGGGTANWDLKTFEFKHPEKAPEVMAVLSVIDQFRPDVHVDVHGTGLQEYAPDQLDPVNVIAVRPCSKSPAPPIPICHSAPGTGELRKRLTPQASKQDSVTTVSKPMHSASIGDPH